MGKIDWSTITREDVIKAIQVFTKDNPEYPEPKSTFLLFDGKKLPAKHIRGMAYKEVYGTEISKNDYAGGMETVRFFRKLGFDVFYNGEILRGDLQQSVSNGGLPGNLSNEILHNNLTLKKPIKKEQKDMAPLKIEGEKPEGRIKISSKDVIEQKNALQLILNRYFNCDVVCEKTYPWLKTPGKIEGEYKPIYDSLKQLQGDSSFAKRNVVLRCDFVCESQKVIIEYDERQHFSQARYVSLSAYPKDIALGYDKELWMRACKDIQAKDSSPKNRDEIRAFYDSVRDIECAKQGYRLVRIMHGQFDWKSENAEQHIEDVLCINSVQEERKNKGIKIGLYLQTQTVHNPEAFQRAMKIATDSDFDILVFPEDCYCPEIEELWQLDIAQKEDVEQIREYCLNLSRQINKAVVFSPFDKYCTPYSVFANHKANETETEFAVYIKHTMAESSVFEFADYKEIAMGMFCPIIYKGHKIGMTICYDCNHAPFSRMWGLNGVDIILNSTGGDVVYDKWYKYNKVRAIENQCYNFVTMGGAGTNDKSHTYVYGFNPEGSELPFHNLMIDTDRTNEINTIYVYDISLDNGKAQIENSFYQTETANKHQDYFFPVGHIHTVLEQAEKIDTNIHILSYNDNTLVFCMVDGLDIMHPEHPLRLLYSDKLKKYHNKRYILINHHKKELEQYFFETKLSVVLKVRAMENFCAVILESPNIKHCYQTGNNRTAQVIPAEDGYYGIDISRTSGPEAIWKNKQGMKCAWRKNFEWLINQISNNSADT